MNKGKSRTRRARKDILKSMSRHGKPAPRRRPPTQYDRTAYDKPQSSEES